MAAMTAGVTGSYLGYLAQRAFLSEKGREEKLRSTHAKAGRRMVSDLQELRGPAMKLGQLFSVQSGMLPDETLAELASLQREAPSMHPSLVRAQFKGAMGTTPENVFRSFDETPFAAASLGQVHRAVTHDGETVAVKIQYPGIKDAVKNDFTWFRAVATASQIKRYFPETLSSASWSSTSSRKPITRQRRATSSSSARDWLRSSSSTCRPFTPTCPVAPCSRSR